MISILFIAIAAMLNAVMDTCETVISFNASKLRKWGFDQDVWCKPISSSMNFIPFTRYRSDAWHICKSFMIVFMVMAIVKYEPVLNHFVDFITLGTVWNLTFNIVYNYLKK